MGTPREEDEKQAPPDVYRTGRREIRPCVGTTPRLYPSAGRRRYAPVTMAAQISPCRLGSDTWMLPIHRPLANNMMTTLATRTARTMGMMADIQRKYTTPKRRAAS